MNVPIRKSWWIEPGKVLGGRFPGTTDPAETRLLLDALLASGVRTIVNLQEPDEPGQDGMKFADYRSTVAELAGERGVDVQCVRLPIKDYGVPTTERMEEIQQAIGDAVDAGRLVYVHCWGGHGRTGTTAACWMVGRLGTTPDQALQTIVERRAHDPHLSKKSAPQTDEQLAFIRQWRPKPRTSGSPSSESQNPALGALLGLAVGDGVGGAVEFKPPGTFAPLTDMIGGGPHDLEPGQWTDDTSMALCLAESLIERGGFDPVDQLTRYVRWWKEGHHSVKGYCFDIGNQVRAALGEFMATGNPFCGPVGPMNAGNGSLMRLSPVVIAYAASSPETTIHYAAKSSRTTHGNAECIDACRYFSGLLIGAISGVPKATLLAAGHTPAPGLWDTAPLRPKVAAVAAGSFKTKQPPQIKGSGYVVDCLEAALWAFHTTDSFEQAVLAAANLGDDADTTAAVCGQIAGAFYGATGIPAEWLNKLARREVIESLARSLVDGTGTRGGGRL